MVVEYPEDDGNVQGYQQQLCGYDAEMPAVEAHLVEIDLRECHEEGEEDGCRQQCLTHRAEHSRRRLQCPDIGEEQIEACADSNGQR